MLNNKFYKFGLILIFLIYVLLAFKDPFSERSLAPNLEPYPDSLYYSIPAWNWVNGDGFKMAYKGSEINFLVPPLYGLVLSPLFFLTKDFRFFYITNMILMIASIYLFIKILEIIFTKEKFRNWYVLLGGFLLVTNFYFYNLPLNLMAENLTIFLMILGMYCLVKQKKIAVFGLFIVSVSLFLTKFSNVSLSVMFGLFYLYKIFKLRFNKFYYLGSSIFFGFLILLVLQNMNLINLAIPATGIKAFSVDYFLNNLNFYLKTIVGGDTRYLWFNQSFFSRLVGISAVLGMVLGLISKRYRKVVLLLLSLVIALVGFMSFFYYPDSRYILTLLPVLIFFCLFFINFIFKKSRIVGFIAIFVLVFYNLFVYKANGTDVGLIVFKKQIGINLIYAEVPWNYKAVKHFEEVMGGAENAYMATFLPPFYGGLVTKGKINFLPITKTQEFSDVGKDLVSQIVGSSVEVKYKEVLNSGGRIFISDYYVSNNLEAWRKEYMDLISNFEVLKISEGCMGACDVYELKLK